jgi:hypothetical protein
MGFPKKIAMAPAVLPSVCRSRRRQESFARPATVDVTDTVSRVVPKSSKGPAKICGTPP